MYSLSIIIRLLTLAEQRFEPSLHFSEGGVRRSPCVSIVSALAQVRLRACLCGALPSEVALDISLATALPTVIEVLRENRIFSVICFEIFLHL